MKEANSVKVDLPCSTAQTRGLELESESHLNRVNPKTKKHESWFHEDNQQRHGHAQLESLEISRSNNCCDLVSPKVQCSMLS